MQSSQKSPAASIALLTWLLAACSMIGPFATDLYLPGFHAMSRSFQVPVQDLQLTLSAYLIGFAVMTPFYGTISDLIGRKPTMVGGFILFALASLGAVFSTSLDALIVFRLFQGLFAGCGLVVGTAVIRDLYSGVTAQKLMAYVSMVFGFGPAFAPVIGGFLISHYPWPSLFVALTCISSLLAALCVFFLPESLPREKRMPMKPLEIIGGYISAARRLDFVFGVLALAISFLGQACFIAGAADWCVNIMHLTAAEFHKLFIPMILGVVLGSALVPKLAVHFSTPTIIRLGFIQMLIASSVALIVAFTMSDPVWYIGIIPLFLYTVGISIIRPGITLILLDMFPTKRGMASSLTAFTQTLLFAFCSAVIVPVIYSNSMRYELQFSVFTLITVFAWCASCLIQKRSMSGTLKNE